MLHRGDLYEQQEKMEELRECLKSMTLNSDYVRLCEHSRDCSQHSMSVMTTCEVQNSMVYGSWEGGCECGMLGHHSLNLN